MWYGYDHGWGWGMGFGMISMVLFWVLVILGIAMLVNWILGGTSGQMRGTKYRAHSFEAAQTEILRASGTPSGPSGAISHAANKKR